GPQLDAALNTTERGRAGPAVPRPRPPQGVTPVAGDVLARVGGGATKGDGGGAGRGDGETAKPDGGAKAKAGGEGNEGAREVDPRVRPVLEKFVEAVGGRAAFER